MTLTPARKVAVVEAKGLSPCRLVPVLAQLLVGVTRQHKAVRAEAGGARGPGGPGVAVRGAPCWVLSSDRALGRGMTGRVLLGLTAVLIAR